MKIKTLPSLLFGGSIVLATVVAQNVIAKPKAEVAPAGHVAPAAITWVDGPPSLPAGSKMAVLFGNPKETGSFTMRLKFPKNYAVPAHWHSTTERITIIEGVLHFGLGKKLDKSKAGPLGAGAHGWVMAKEPHFAYTEAEGATLQLDALGPWDITYIKKSDDPRKMASK